MHTLLPLDDCLYALQPSIPHLTRSSLHRCFQRHDISRLPDAAGDNSCLDFEGCWFVHSVAMDNMDDVETVHPNVADFLQLVADLVALFDKLSAGMLENTVAFFACTRVAFSKFCACHIELKPMSESHEWTVCDKPAIGDILRWNEPLWAAPTRPRGKPDRAGEQRITAEVTAIGDVLEFKVLTIEKISPGEAVLKVTEGDNIRRKASTLAQGQCHKRTI